ncbi:MAG: glycosyltransferase family 39 protein, partial [Patescibacteria group bacterium]
MPPLGGFTAKWGKWMLAGILILAAALRLYGLSRGDTLTDEVLYAFRAVGPLDFDEAEAQTTPLEWLDPNIPWWTSLSFHDHPPLVFWVQHIFIKIFGETNFVFRLPSVILGLLSIWLLYLIGKKLYSEETGLLAAFLLAVTVNHVYISRTGLQEAYVIFFILLASYLFLRALEKDDYLIWTSIALGFGFLAKYTVFVLVPIFFVYALL